MSEPVGSAKPPKRLVDIARPALNSERDTNSSFTDAEKAIDSAWMLKLGEHRMMKFTIAMTTAAFALTTAGSALAGGAISAGYGGKAGPSVGNILGTPTNTAVHTGTLPFTGLNLVVFAAVALLLLVLGAVLLRTNRRDQPER
jgi:hypothetical protein